MWKFQAAKSDRLDRLLRGEKFPGAEWFSRNAFESLVENGRVFVAGKRVKKSGAAVEAGAEILLELPDQLGLLRGEREAALLWADSSRALAVFQKEAGISTYPLLPWEKDTFANQVVAFLERNQWMKGEEFAALADPPKLEGGLLQRLDRDTSGLLLVALKRSLKDSLHQALIMGKIRKTYLAICGGIPAAGRHAFRISDAGGGGVKATLEAGAASVVDVKVCKRAGAFSLVEVQTSHGARHIVRATLAALGAPLVGDRQYGGDAAQADFHQLHAARIELAEPSLFPAFPGNLETLPPQSFVDCLHRLGLH